ncbi:MAG TPA: hypothetical protein VHS09_11185 [Polyangiaceae bacterium]|jgi:hypothetical protein|nr:hypothetical protein [Polyangiaceae bacterium]
MRAGLVAVAIAVVGAGGAGCGKSTAPSASMPSPGGSGAGGGDAGAAATAAGTDDAGAAPMDAREAMAWTAATAKDADADDLARLADLVGCEGLRERSDDASRRLTALRAAQFCRDFSELPWLAEVAASGTDEEARAALDAAVELAARPRRATDPDDADELHVGCGALLDLARGPERPRERRVLAIRALRMLVDRGCVKKTDIPTDLDAH